MATVSETAKAIPKTQHVDRIKTADTSTQIPTAAKVTAEDAVALSSQGGSSVFWSVQDAIRVPWTAGSEGSLDYSVLATVSETAKAIPKTQHVDRTKTADTSTQIPTAAKVTAEDAVALSSQGGSSVFWSVQDAIRVPWTAGSEGSLDHSARVRKLMTLMLSVHRAQEHLAHSGQNA